MLVFGGIPHSASENTAKMAVCDIFGFFKIYRYNLLDMDSLFIKPKYGGEPWWQLSYNEI